MKKEIKTKNIIKNIAQKKYFYVFFLLCLFFILSPIKTYAANGYNPMLTGGGDKWAATAWFEQVTDGENLSDDFWIAQNKDSKDIAKTLKEKQAQCMIYTKEEKEKVNIAQYKEYLGQRFFLTDYIERENYDYIVNKYGEKYYSWVVKECLMGYDTPSNIHGATQNSTLTMAKGLMFTSGELVYLHRTPIYDLTLFVPSRYQWWYTKNNTSSFEYGNNYTTISEDHVPPYEQLSSNLKQIDRGGYTKAIVNIVNNNISFFAPKYILTYSAVPHVLGSEGIAKDGTYIGTGAVYALMDEVNGFSVPVYISHSAQTGSNLGSLTPFWSFTSPALPNTSKHIFVNIPEEPLSNFSTKDEDEAVWWRFEIEKGTDGYTWLSSIIALDQSCGDPDNINQTDFEHAYYGNREEICKRYGTVYGAKQHAIIDARGERFEIGFRDNLEKAIIYMGGPLLVSSIDLAMDEALLQRNASVNFMLTMNGNLNADFGSTSIKDAGYTWATQPSKNLEIGTARYTGNPSNATYVRNQTINTALPYMTQTYSEPVNFIYNQLQLLNLSTKSSAILTTNNISSAITGRAFLSTIVNTVNETGLNAVYGFKTISLGYPTKNTRSDRNVGASFKTGNTTFIRNAGFRKPVTASTLTSDASAYGMNINYRRFPGKVYSSAIVSIPTVIDIVNNKGEANEEVLYYPGFYNFYKNDLYHDNEPEKISTNNKILNITYGYHSFYSYGRYGMLWDWTKDNKANTLPNDTNTEYADGFSVESIVKKVLTADPYTNLYNIFDGASYSSFWSSEKNDDWGVWRNQGYLLSGNEWLSGSFPNDLNEYSLDVDYNAVSSYRVVRYPWMTTSNRWYHSVYFYSKVFLEYYYAKTWYPDSLDTTLKQNNKIWEKFTNNNTSNIDVGLKTWKSQYEQILDTYESFVLTDPLILQETSTLVKRTSQNGYTSMQDKVFSASKEYVTTNAENYFKSRAYTMKADTGDSTITAFRKKIYSFEKEYCKRLTMSYPINNGECPSGKVAVTINGYGTMCVNAEIENLPITSDNNRGLISDYCKLSDDKVYQNSFSAFIDAANQYYPGSTTTYLEDLAYLWLSYNSLTELASDFSIGQSIRFHPYSSECGSGVCPDKSVTYWHKSSIGGDFSNLTVLNNDNRFNNYFCSTGINGTNGCEGRDTTTLSFLKTSGPNGEEIQVPRLSPEYSTEVTINDKNVSTNPTGNYSNRYGPELFLLNELDGKYMVELDAQQLDCQSPWYRDKSSETYLEPNQILCKKHEITKIAVTCPSGYKYDTLSDTCVEDAISQMRCETGFIPFFENCIKTSGTVIGCANPNEVYNDEIGLCVDINAPWCDVDVPESGYNKGTGICSVEQEKNSCKYGGSILNGKCVVAISEFTGREASESITNITYTGKIETINLDAGIYRIEAWGASGGGAKNKQLGGGYAAGTLKISSSAKLYVSVGGTTSSYAGGFNGGGDGTTRKSFTINNETYTITGYGGGGATDISISNQGAVATKGSSASDPNKNAYKQRILVAGGGGGTAIIQKPNGTISTLYGGGGGGASGESGTYTMNDGLSEFLYGNGASSYENGKNKVTFTTRVFNIITSSDTYKIDKNTTALNGIDNKGGTSFPSYYPVAGGGGGFRSGSAGLPGGGGSGFIFTNSQDENYGLFNIEATNLSGSSFYVLSDTEILTSNGFNEITNPNNSVGVGNIGNGYVRITRLDVANNLTQTCEHLLVGNNENGEPKINTHTAKLKETYVGNSEKFLYSGRVEEYVVPVTGKFLIEAWGAQGGSSSDGVEGGKGGYSTTVLDLKKNDKLFLYVGGQGKKGSMVSEVAGGFNGGGKASPGGGGSGGGATDIRLYNDSLANRVIVAGGGGGAGKQFTYTGGYGGGSIAGLGNGAFYPRATSTSGYSASGGATVDTSGLPIASTSNAGATNLYSGGGAGGGGFYGGYSGFKYGGGGGSGYVSKEDPYGYMLDGDSIFQTINSSTIYYEAKNPIIPVETPNEDFHVSIYYQGEYIDGNSGQFAKVINDQVKEISINTSILTKEVNYNCEDTTIYDDGIIEANNKLQSISFADSSTNISSDINTITQKTGSVEFDNAQNVSFDLLGVNVPDDKLAIIDLYLKMNAKKATIKAFIPTDNGFEEIASEQIEKNFDTSFVPARLYLSEKYKDITSIRFTISVDEVSTKAQNISLQKIELFDAKDKVVKDPLIYCTVKELRNHGFKVNYNIENDNDLTVTIEAPLLSLDGNGTYEKGHAGDGAIRITAIELDDNTWQAELVQNKGTLKGSKPTQKASYVKKAQTVLIKEKISIDLLFEYDEDNPVQQVTLNPGTYTFELYGGAGGKGFNNTNDSVGKGGYTEGTITVTDTAKTFYLYIGGKGEDAKNSDFAKGGRSVTFYENNQLNKSIIGDIRGGEGGLSMFSDYGGGGGGGATIVSSEILTPTSVTPESTANIFAWIVSKFSGQCAFKTKPIYTNSSSSYTFSLHNSSHTWTRNSSLDKKFYTINNTNAIYLVAGGGGGSPAKTSSSVHSANYKGGEGSGANEQMITPTDGIGYKFDITGKLTSSTDTGGKAGIKGTGGNAGAVGSYSNNPGAMKGGSFYGGSGASGYPKTTSTSIDSSAGAGGGGAGYGGGGGGNIASNTNSTSYPGGGGGGDGYAKPGIFNTDISDSNKTEKLPGEYKGINGQNSGNGYIRIYGEQNQGQVTVYQDTTTDHVHLEFDYNANNQIQTVELEPGEYTINAWGANGGGSANGGYGAFATSNINLTQKTTLKILVGQRGQTRASGSGSGGGASYVTTNNNVPIVIAGGGGGNGAQSGDYIHAQGSREIYDNGMESIIGFGGWSDTTGKIRSAGAGGGFYSNGSYNTINGRGSGGYSYVSGGTPGFSIPKINSSEETIGGFGGGGSTADDELGGGGGGYTGGTAGFIINGDKTYSSGTGGSSYVFGEGETISGGNNQPSIDGSGVSSNGNPSKNYNGYVLIEGVKNPNAGDGNNSIYQVNERILYQTNSGDIGNLKVYTLDPGTYRLETWGAQGSLRGGKGGYASGELTLTERTTLYIKAGRSVSNGNAEASDIRIGGTSEYNRILVAGAGGTARVGTGGAGGGLSGKMGYSTTYNIGNINNALPGTQTEGGETRKLSSTDTDYSSGSFGKGGYVTTSYGSYYGGDGWFGGGASKLASSAGGSSFALSSTTANIAHSINGWNVGKNFDKVNSETGETETIYNDEQYYLRNVIIISGEESMPQKGNTSQYTIGNSGDGYVRITQIEKDVSAQRVSSIDKVIEAVNHTGYFEAIDFKKDFSYTGVPEKITLEPGAYYVEAWGAEGGSSKTPDNVYKNGEKGEYSRGIVTLEKETDVYVYVGGAAGDINNGYVGGYNGGANGSNNLHLQNATASYWAGGGGGSSEVRFVNDNHNSATVVAAGGDGASTSFKVGNSIFGMNVRVAGGYSGGFNVPTIKSFLYNKNTKDLVPEDYALDHKFYLTGNKIYSKDSDNGFIFKDPNGIEENGHSGNGYVRIQRVRKKIVTHPEVKVNKLAANTQYYQYTGDIQKAILEPGIYLIQTWGAIGGDGREIFDYEGGYGAYSTSTIQVFNRTQINVLVGQSGFAQSEYAGAGGGGSFVATTTGIPLSVAGGGGGAGGNGYIAKRSNETYKNGQGTEISGYNELMSSIVYKLVPGYGGISNGTPGQKQAGAGGGFYGDGEIADTNKVLLDGSSGRSFLAGGTIGYGYTGGTNGGFGGGGGTANDYLGGGGGGYTGGTGGLLSNNETINGYSGAGGGSYNTGYGYTASGKSTMPSYYVSNFNQLDYSSDYSSINGNDQDGIVMITRLTDEIIDEYAPELKTDDMFAQYYENESIKHFTSQYFEKDSVNMKFVDYAAQTGNLVANEIETLELLPGEYLVEMWGASSADEKGAYIATKLEITEPTSFEYWLGKKDSTYIVDTTKLKDSRTSTTYLYDTTSNQIVGYVGSTNNAIEGYHHYIIDNTGTMPAPTGGNEIGHNGDGNMKITVLNIKSNKDSVDLRTGNGYQVKQPEEIRKIYYCALYYRGGADVVEHDRHETTFSQTFEYTGNTALVNLKTGVYKLEAWGAQGGSYNTIYGGKGGYASTYLVINNPGNITDDYSMPIYVTVGPQGGTGAYLPTTFNGGGGTKDIINSRNPSGQGGGATHFATIPGELKDFKTPIVDNRDQVLLVAGGGGGRSHSNSGGIANGAFDPDTMTCENEHRPSNWRGGRKDPANYSNQFGLAGDGSGHGGGGGGGYCAGKGEPDCEGNGYGGYGYANNIFTSENSNFYLEKSNVYSGGEQFIDISGKNMELGHSGNGYAKISGAEYVYTENKFHVTIDTFLEYDEAAYKYDLTCALGYEWNDVKGICEKIEQMTCTNADNGYSYSVSAKGCIVTDDDITCTNNAEPMLINNKMVCAFIKSPTCPGDKWISQNGRCVLKNPDKVAPEKCYGTFSLNEDTITTGDKTYNPGEVCERYLTEIITDKSNTDDPVKATPLKGDDAIILLDNIYSYRNYIKYTPSSVRGAFFLNEKLTDSANNSFTGEPLFPQLTTDLWLSTADYSESNCLVNGTCTELEYYSTPANNSKITIKIPIPLKDTITSGTSPSGSTFVHPFIGSSTSKERFFFATDPNYNYNAELSTRVWAAFKLGSTLERNNGFKIKEYNKLYSSNDFEPRYVMVDFIFQITKEGINIMNRDMTGSVSSKIKNNGSTIDDVTWNWDYSLTWTDLVNNGLINTLGNNITEFFDVEKYSNGDRYLLKIFDIKDGKPEQKINSIMFTSRIDSFKLLNTENARALSEWIFNRTGSQIFKQTVFFDETDLESISNEMNVFLKTNKDKKTSSFLTGDMNTLDNASLYVTKISESSSDLIIDRFEIITNDDEGNEVSVYTFEAMKEERCTTPSIDDYVQVANDKVYVEHPTTKVSCERYDLGSSPLALDKDKNYRMKAYVLWDPLTSGLDTPYEKEIYLDITSIANSGSLNLGPYLAKQNLSSMTMTAKSDNVDNNITPDKAVEFSLENTAKHYLNNEAGINNLIADYYDSDNVYLSELYGKYSNSSGLLLPLQRFTYPKYRTDKDLKLDKAVSDGYVILSLSSKNKPINKLKKWDSLSFFYNLNICKVDNAITIITKCKKYVSGEYEEIPTIKNGCFIIRTDDSVKEIDRYVVNEDSPCKIYARVSRPSGDNNCPTTSRINWSTSDNRGTELGNENLKPWEYEIRNYCSIAEGKPANACTLHRWSSYDDSVSNKSNVGDYFETDSNYEPYKLINVGDTSEEIFVRYIDGKKSYYNVHLEYRPQNNGNFYDTNMLNNVTEACWSFGTVNYAVDQPVFTPSRINIGANEVSREITFEGSYNINRTVDLKSNSREIPVRFRVQGPNAQRTDFVDICTIDNAAEVVGDAYDEYGNPINRIPSTSKTVHFEHPESSVTVSQNYEFKFTCNLDLTKYNNNDEFKLFVEINGGDEEIVQEPNRLFDEAMYNDNVSSNFGMFKEIPVGSEGCTPECTSSNLWNIAFDFVYELNREIDEYHTQKKVYMTWVDYDVLNSVSKISASDEVKSTPSESIKGQNVWVNTANSKGELNFSNNTNANSNGSYNNSGFNATDDKIYDAPEQLSQGNVLRAPYDYLAFKSQITKTTGNGNTYAPLDLCTDYRANNDECWRYEHNVYHTVTYYRRTGAITKTYATYQTLPYSGYNTKTSSGSWQPSNTNAGKIDCSIYSSETVYNTKLSLGAHTRTNYGSTEITSNGVGYEGAKGSSHNYANSTCLKTTSNTIKDLGYVNDTGTKTYGGRCENGEHKVCHGYNDANTKNGSATDCPTITDWWGNKICASSSRVYSDNAASGSHPSDYIPFEYFGDLSSGGVSASNSLTSGNGYPINDNASISTTTKTNKIVLQQTRTQGAANPGWVEVRSQEVCSAKAYADISYRCPTNYTYGTYGKDGKVNSPSPTGAYATVYYCKNNSCSKNQSSVASSHNWNTGDTINKSEHTYIVCNMSDSITTRPKSSNVKPVGYGDTVRKCHWISDQYTPGTAGETSQDFIWWNTAPQTCFREHQDWKCNRTISDSNGSASLTSNETITNTANNYNFTCEWKSTDAVDWKESSCQYVCGETCDSEGNCSPDYCDSVSYSGSCKSILNLSGTFHGDSNPGCNEGTDSSAYCTYKKTNSSRVTKSNYENGITPINKYATVSCSSGDYTEDITGTNMAPLCYETRAEQAVEKTNQRCVRWETMEYKEIKYYSTDTPSLTFNSRFYGEGIGRGYHNDVYMKQYSCNRKFIGGGDVYPDQITIKQYQETFDVQIFVETERGGKGNWIAVPDGGELDPSLVPRAGEYFDVKAVATYATTRGQQPAPMPFLSEYYNNYHNDTTFESADVEYKNGTGLYPNAGEAPASYKHWGQCSGSGCLTAPTVLQDIVNNQDYGYCDAKIAEPYGCSYSGDFKQYAMISGDRNENNDAQGQNGIDWVSNKNPRNGVCYYGPDNWNILSSSHRGPSYTGYFGDSFTSAFTIKRKTASGDIISGTTNLVQVSGTCRNKSYSLCTEYQTVWQTPIVLRANGTVGTGFYVEVDDSTAQWLIEYSNGWFDAVAKYEQTLLSNSGPEGAVWGNTTTYFNLVNGIPIKPLCDCPAIKMNSRGEVAWASSEWEVE